MLPIELWQAISEYLDVSGVLAVSSLAREFRHYIFLLYLVRPRNLDSAVYLPLLRNLTRLDLSKAIKVHPRTLAKLTKLRELDISYNPYITQLNHPNLEKLRARSFCSFRCGLNKLGSLPKLTSLDLANNGSIKDISMVPMLQHLDISGFSAIGDRELASMTRLVSLVIDGNRRVTRLKHFESLTSLSARDTLIDQEEVVGLRKLRDLILDRTYTVYDLAPLSKTLVSLSLNHGCHPDLHQSLAGLHLKKLLIVDNPFISVVKSDTLTELDSTRCWLEELVCPKLIEHRREPLLGET
jgi:hypothetical protein